MLLVSILMFVSAISLIRKPRVIKPDDYVDAEPYRFIPTVLGGLLVGFLSGLLGTGGGFLIIPALLFFARLGMKTAIGTSLIIITTNTAIGFLSDLHNASEFNWNLLAIFTALSVAGILTGTYISKYISGYKLKTAFGWFIFAIATFIITKYLVVSL